MPTPPIVDLVATTLKLSKGDFQNNVYQKGVLTATLKKDGSVTPVSGGLTIEETLTYGKNTTFGSTRGADVLPVEPQEEFTAASFTMASLAGTVQLLKDDILKNRGPSEIKNWANKKKENAVNSAGSMMEDIFFGNGGGNSGKNPAGLLAIAPQDPTADTLGGIPSATQTYWRSKQANDADSTYSSGADTAISFASNGIRLMGEMYTLCSMGSGVEAPTLILCDRSTWLRYQRALGDKVRYTNADTSGTANFGFNGIQFFGANLMWTDRIGATAKTIASDGYQVTFPAAGVMFFLNTKHIFIRQYQGWETGDFMEAQNQRAWAAKTDWSGQMTTDLRRVQGSLWHFID